MNEAEFERLHAATVRVLAQNVVQSGFLVAPDVVVTCAHGFPRRAAGDILKVEWGGTGYTFTVVDIDETNDVLILRSSAALTADIIPLGKGVLPGDRLYSWGSTERYPDGESATLEVEGWSRNPHLLKLKSGMVEQGMSGAPLYSTTDRRIVGMLKTSRDVNAPSGARGVMSSTILEILSALDGGAAAPLDPSEVQLDDLPKLLGVFEAAYEMARPAAPVDRRLPDPQHEDWAEGLEMLQALKQVEEHNVNRRSAVRRWYDSNPRCMRFVVTDGPEGPRRVGATCVLPLESQGFHRYRGGRVREFDLSDSDVVELAGGGRSSYLCFQSFALTARGNRKVREALRTAIRTHVVDLAQPGRKARVVAEVGTQAGLREAHFFGMSFAGLSADSRPLFETQIEGPPEEDASTGSAITRN